MADAETVRRRDRGADPGLGVAHGGFHILALRKPRGDRRGQRAAGAMGVFGRDARRGERDDAGGVDRDSRCSRRPAPWPPLISTAWQPSASSRLPCCSIGGFARATGSSSSAAASGRFGVISDGARNEFCSQRLDGFGRQQPIARGRDHHGIEHDMLRRPARQPRDNGIDHRRCATMPILTAPTARSENTASICAVTNSAGT